ncbi:MAG: glycosyltransferase family 2 protein [Syntrophomonas sp.]
MENNPLISIVIPAFNRENTITYCLDSILAQTYKNLEVIVVDDCSTDKTVPVVRSHPDPRVRCVVLEKNSGAQAARNRGIQEAQADWIAFQDSDDEWLPEKLARQVSVLASAGYDPWSLVYCNAYRFDKERGTRSIRLLPAVEGENQYATLLQMRAMLFPTIITSKKALEKIGYLDEQVPSFQEWDTSIRLARYCKITHLKEPLMVYHADSGNAISGSSTKHVEGLHYIIGKYESDIKRLCGEKAWLKLNFQLLGTCLDLGLMSYYDRYKGNIGMSTKYNLQMIYLVLCRKFKIRPSIIINRFTLKLLARLGYFAANRQGSIVKV